MRIPDALAKTWRHEAEWLDAIPRLAAECAADWGLDLEEPIDTPHSLVVPAGDAVLKLNAPSHFEAEQEADALALWAGHGAVRLFARDDSRRALLIERCVPGTPLWQAADIGEADELQVILQLLPRVELRLEESHPFSLLSTECERWSQELPAAYAAAGAPFERSLLDFALDVFRSVDHSARYLVNPDLHGLNVLSARREPWLVIDPKPLAGEREIHAVGPLRNAGDVRAQGPAVTDWLDAFRDLGLDRERARSWSVAHTLAWSWDERDGWGQEHLDAARAILNAR